jgi:hypothetical protein
VIPPCLRRYHVKYNPFVTFFKVQASQSVALGQQIRAKCTSEKVVKGPSAEWDLLDKKSGAFGPARVCVSCVILEGVVR